MSDHSSDTGTFQLLDPAAHTQFALHDRREIAQILRTLANRNILLTACPADRPAFQTVILELPSERATVVIDGGPGMPPEGYRALTCVTRLDKVKIQFTLSAPLIVTRKGRPALEAALPESLLRLQRREFFRVATPLEAEVVCVIPHSEADGREHGVAVRILDLSSGGLAVVVPPKEIAFAPGDEFERCQLRLPEGEPLQVRLKVRNLFTIERPNGLPVRRAGCEFIGLSNAAAARIQRYLFKLERERLTDDSDQGRR